MRYRYLILDLEVNPVPPRHTSEAGLEALLVLMGLRILAHTGADYPGPKNAYTSAWILAESHAILHTAPEESWVEIVLATCSDKVDVALFEEKVKRVFAPIRLTSRQFEGTPPWPT